MGTLLQDMMRREFYPHPCERIELFQTISSWLLFAGQFVYKVRKPLKLPFFDASSREKRLELCQNEVRVNRRIAPDVYLNVRGIVENNGSHVLADDAAAPNMRDFAVVMRRLPEDRKLERMVANDSVTESDMRELARKLAAFHAGASTAKSAFWGSSEAIFRLVTCGVTEAEKIVADSVTRELLESVGAYLRRQVAAHQQTLDNRQRDGRVCEGHGGLRRDLVFFEEEAPAILGCVDYLESLRYADVASDLASLVVDLELLGRSDLARTLLDAYETESGDYKLWEVLPFYKCYRAVCQARFKALESLQQNIGFEQRIIARERARELFLLANRYTTTI